MIQVEGYHHVTIFVRDLERTRKFYDTVLGLREIDRPPIRFKGCWFAIGELQLHVVVDDRRTDDPLFSDDRHFALAVSAFDQVPDKLERLGIPFHGGSTGRVQQIFFRDPDGNLIELQPLKQPSG